MQRAEQNPSRFLGRVDSYRRFRPTYPREIVPFLSSACGLSKTSTIVDVAAGTGLFTELFLENGNEVVAVEPNPEMREACAQLQPEFPKLRIRDGYSDSTGVPDSSADFVTAAQAMHWFDLTRTRAEFARILRPEGWCVVAYNDRQLRGDAFHDGYEHLLKTFGIDYEKVRASHVSDEVLREFFAPATMLKETFDNSQRLTRDALLGRVLSSSYMPQAGHPRYAPMVEALDRLFAANQTEGFVVMRYQTTLRYGQLRQHPK